MIAGNLELVWITTRAAGTVALLGSSASVILGLSLAGRMPKGRGRLGDARTLHQTFGIITLTALAIHLISLAFDPWLEPSVSELAIPFTLDYRAVWTGIGIIAGYGFLVFGLSGYLRRRLGKRWAWIHRMTGVAWAMAVAHSLGSGSDAGQPWMLALVACCVVPVVVLAAIRIAQARRKPSAGARTGGRTVRPPAEARASALAARASVAPPSPRA